MKEAILKGHKNSRKQIKLQEKMIYNMKIAQTYYKYLILVQNHNVFNYLIQNLSFRYDSKQKLNTKTTCNSHKV